MSETKRCQEIVHHDGQEYQCQLIASTLLHFHSWQNSRIMLIWKTVGGIATINKLQDKVVGIFFDPQKLMVGDESYKIDAYNSTSVEMALLRSDEKHIKLEKQEDDSSERENRMNSEGIEASDGGAK